MSGTRVPLNVCFGLGYGFVGGVYAYTPHTELLCKVYKVPPVAASEVKRERGYVQELSPMLAQKPACEFDQIFGRIVREGEVGRLFILGIPKALSFWHFKTVPRVPLPVHYCGMDPVVLSPVFTIVIFSIILHEIAHGYMADMLGDPTARYAGRLTLNPLPHIDLFGSIILPGLMALTSGPLIGWAKPVPYNPFNIRTGKWGEALVGFAGPGVNILLAIFFGLMVRFFAPELSSLTITILYYAGAYNLLLAFLNLIPIPPLDGSKILKAILPYPLARSYANLESITYALGPFGLIGVLLLFIYVFSGPVSKLVFSVFSFIVGA